MSEIKGQILGILLVLAIFGAVSGVLVAAFKNSANNIAEKVGSEPEISVASTSATKTNIVLLKY